MVRRPAHPRQEIWCCRKVDAEVDLSQLVNAVEPLDPNRRLLGILLVLTALLLVEQRIVVVGFRPDAVGVVGLVVEHEEIPLLAQVAAEDPLDQRTIAFHPALASYLDAHQVACLVDIALQNLELAPSFERAQLFERHVTAASRRCGPGADANRLLRSNSPARPRHP